MNQKFERVEKHLYRRQYQTAGGDWSTLHYGIFTDWKKVRRRFPLGSDLKTARDELKVLHARNVRKEDFDEHKERMTFSVWRDRYLTLVKKKRSLERDRQHCDHLVEFFGPLFLEQITRAKIMEYKNRRLEQPIMRYIKAGKNSPGGHLQAVDGSKTALSTVNRELSCLHHMLRLAAEEGLIESVPIIKRESEEHLQRERILSDEELQKLFANAPRWLQLTCIGAFETCLSRGDLIALDRDQVDRKAGLIRVRGGRQKTRVKQVVPISPALDAVLDELEKVRAIDDHGRIFTRNGKPITKDALRSSMRAACEKACIEDFTFHDFRHMAKTHWAKMGVPAEAAMRAAGHKSLAMHYRYVNLNDDHLRELFTQCLHNHPAKKTSSASS